MKQKPKLIRVLKIPTPLLELGELKKAFLHRWETVNCPCSLAQAEA